MIEEVVVPIMFITVKVGSQEDFNTEKEDWAMVVKPQMMGQRSSSRVGGA